jgi:hypothetical protein
MRDHKTIVPHKTELPIASSRPSYFNRAGKALRRGTTLSLATVGVGTVAVLAYDFWLSRVLAKKDDEKKKVLVLPFHRMKLVENGSSPFSNIEDGNFEVSWFRNQIKIYQNLCCHTHTYHSHQHAPQIEVSKLVHIIHAAAQDPSIAALYGTFGHGFQFRAGGWAHVEEVRNALKVWRESHRVHLEPNLKHDTILNRPCNGASKPSYAYAVSFRGTHQFFDGT